MIGALLCLTLTATEPLRLWHSYRGGEESVLRDLAAHAPEPVELTQIPFDTLQAKLLQALSVGNGPDVFIAPHERLLDWQRYLTQVPAIDADVTVAREAVTIDGALYGYPFALKTLALVRNRALVPEAVATLEALPRPAGGNALGFDASEFYFHSPFFFAFTDSLFGPQGQMQIAPGLASFTWLREQTRSGFVPRGFNHTQLVARFKSQHISALIDGPWVLSDLGDGIALAVQPLPPFHVAGELRTPRPFATVDALFLPTGAHVARAQTLARWLASDAHCVARTERARALPPYRACAAQIAESDPLRGFFAALDNAIPMPIDRGMGMAWTPLKHLMATVTGNDEPLAAAAADAENEFARLRIEDRPSPVWLDIVVYAAIVALLGWWWSKRKRSEPKRSSGIAYVLLAPGALFVAFFLLIPLAVGGLLSLFSHDAGSFHYMGFGNFTMLLSSPGFLFTLGVTILWTAVNLCMHLVLGISLALLLDRPTVRFGRMWRALLILPWAVPNYISALVFHNLFNYELGAINQALGALGISRIDWFGSFFTAFSANVITNAWLGFPFVMVMTLGALQGIDASLIEAMRLDGATAWQRFRHLTIPQIAPVLAPAMLLSAMWTFNMFNVIYLVSGGEPRDETNILISEAYRWAFERGARYGYAAAYCVTIFLLLWLFVKARERMDKADA